MIRVQAEPFVHDEEVAKLIGGRSDVGAIASFQGLVRDQAKNQQITAMTLEHYPGMTEKELNRIDVEAQQRWPLQASLIVHRYGRLLPADPIVLCIAVSAHRDAAFQACAFIMDYLKTQAPFWKLEETADGSEWVEAKEKDDAAASRW